MSITVRAEAVMNGRLTATPSGQGQTLGLHGLKPMDLSQREAMGFNAPSSLREDSHAEELVAALVDGSEATDMQSTDG